MSASRAGTTPPSVLCIGELVWDVFLDATGAVLAEHLGGAQMNVAYHLGKLGCDVTLLARVGSDPRGDAAIRALAELNVPIDHVQRDTEHATGTSLVTTNACGEPQYELLPNVAWDFIARDSASTAVITPRDAIVFGSLGQRATVSRMSIRALIGPQRWRIFDVNLRPPFDEWAIIEWSLQHANVVKVNASEMVVLSSRLDLTATPAAFAEGLAMRYGLALVVVTLGADGAGAWHAGTWSFKKAPSVAVVDTVGAGDAFLAGFTAAWLQGADLDAALTRGCALGALVSSRAGATPRYQLADIK